MNKKSPNISIKKMKWKLFLLGIFKIPMIGFVRPKLLMLDEQKVKVKIKLSRKTKNHLNSMYFGALAVGADVAAGIHAFYFSEIMGYKISFAFKGMHADFLKRAESDVVFEITEGLKIKKAVEESKNKKERVNTEVEVLARNEENEIVAKFNMIVSVKVKG